MLPDCSKVQNQNVQMFGYVLHDTNAKNQGTKLKIPWYLLNETYNGHPVAGLLWERQFEEALLELGWEKIPNWECMFFHRKQRLFSVSIHGWHQNRWKETEMALMWKKWRKNVNLDEPTSFLDHACSGCTQRECKSNENIIKNLNKMFESRISAGPTEKTTGMAQTSRTNSRVVLPHGGTRSKKCVERYCEFVNKKLEQLHKVSHLCLDDHQFKQEELKSFAELSEVCSQSVLRCVFLARIGRPDILWSVNKLARSVTKWTPACDKRSARLTILSCGKHSTALQTGLVPRLRLCWRPWGLQINFRWCLVYFWK